VPDCDNVHVVTIVGARPQFVKAAAVSRALAAQGGARETLVHTGQHFDANMSDVFFEELEIAPPAHHLGVSGGGHGEQTGRILERVEAVLRAEQPDVVLVYGDTNSTLAGALAAAKLHVPVAHVEAGLRSFNRRMPEEVNRVLTDHVSTRLFAPTSTAVENLRREGCERGVHLVGDVMYDVALRFSAIAQQRSTLLSELGLPRGKYLLATIHRQENTDDPERLRTVFAALGELAADLPVVLPLHPRTRKALSTMAAAVPPGLMLIEPVSYLDMIMLERHARLIATDSGGVQKEAFFFRVPCVTLRDETEWVELVDAGWNTLAPPTSVPAVTRVLRAALASDIRATQPKELYGNGTASEQIAQLLLGERP
jgi:UDP-GlcNAc3NAcA epimerase